MELPRQLRDMKIDPLKSRRLLEFVVALSLLVLAGTADGAEKAVIRDIAVSNSSRELLLYFQVGEAFRPEMIEGVLNGIPATFTFMISLREIEGGRPGRQLAELAFEHTLSFDVLKEEFRLNFTEHATAQTCRDPALARKMMAEVSGVKILPLRKLTPGREYFLSAKVKLERKTLPLFFHYLIPFWQLRDYETDWHYVQFQY
jgi:hypothetical protein